MCPLNRGRFTGNAVVVGYTGSANFPTYNAVQPSHGGGGYDASVTKINPSGSGFVFSTYHGGNSSDYGMGVDVDGSGNVYVTGWTFSTNFPIVNAYQPSKLGLQAAYVTKFDATGGSRLYSTYLGGSNADYGTSITVDNAGNASICGYTYSSNFPTVAPLQATIAGGTDAFVAQFLPDGSNLNFSTYYGGSNYDYGYGIDIDGNNCLHLTGNTRSTNFPTHNAFQSAHGGGYYDAFAVKICLDNEPPVALCQDVAVDADVNCEAMASVDNGSYDPDGDPVTITQTPAGPYPLGMTVVTLRITDDGGLWDECVGTVTVVDNTNPVATCPADMTVNTDLDVCDAVVNFVATFTDNCPGGAIVCVPASGTAVPLGVTTVTCTATDAAGNTDICNFNITVVDNQDPDITFCPPNMNVNTDPNVCQAVVNYPPAIAADNCPGVTITYSHASGAIFPEGTTTVTVTATDAAGNTDVCTFDVVVTDNQAPNISFCPPSVTVGNDVGQCNAVVNYPPAVAGDNCGVKSITYSHASGATFPLGATVVTVTVDDDAGNVTTCNFTITVNDTEDPDITCPANITVAAAAGVCFANVNFVANATDNCPGVGVTYSHAPGSAFPVGITTVTATATDGAGNTDNCTFTVTVVDTQPPVFTFCPPNQIRNNDPGDCGAIVIYPAATAIDNCGAVILTYSKASGAFFDVGTTVVTVTATDGTGNTATCNFSVTIIDNEDPDITCPDNMVVDSDLGYCGAWVSFPAAIATDNCPGLTITYSNDPGTYFPVGVTVVTATATDAVGLTDDCTFNVTVYDTEAPEAHCPDDMTVSTAEGECSAMVEFTATFDDNCPGGSIVCVPPSGSTFPLGQTLVTCTATDSMGITDICTFTITVDDNEDPVLDGCPDNIALNNDPGLCSAVADWTDPTATDNCPGVLVSCSPPSGSTFPVGVTTVTCTATDAAGNTDVCTFTVTVTDVEDPVATCPADIEVDNDPGLCSAWLEFDISATDNCAVTSLTSNPMSGTTFMVGVTHVEVVAVDAAGNADTCHFTVTVNDTELPVPTCPGDIEVNVDPGQCGAVVEFLIDATDNCEVVLLYSSPQSGSFFDVGVTEVLVRAHDQAGNVGDCVFYVTVIDNEAPVATCPDDMIVPNDPGDCGAIVTFLATVTDNCPNATIACVPPSGSYFPHGETWVECTATDASGNTHVCGFPITVFDDEDPVAQCPDDIIVPNDEGQCGAVVVFSATVIDNCPSATISCDPPSGSFFPVGVTTVTCTAIDFDGNSDQCTFTVTVNDTEDPTALCGGNITVYSEPGLCGAIVDFPVEAVDNCPGVTVEANPPPESFFDVGDVEVVVTATDASGNTDVCTFTVTVIDNEDPVATCPADMIVGTDEDQCGANVTWTASADDNCPGVTIVCTPASGSFFGLGEHTVQCIATDVSGNQTLCSFTITVNDDDAPVALCPGNIEVDNDAGECGAVVEFIIDALDNCGVITLYSDPPSGSFFDVGDTEVLVRAHDEAGNVGECVFTVTVNDTEKPVPECPGDKGDIIVSNDPGTCGAVVTFTATVTDNCPGATISCAPPSGSYFSVGTTVVTCTAVDSTGNSDTCKFNVIVNDTEPPVATCPGDMTVGSDPGACGAMVNFTATVTDNCPGASIACVPPSGSYFPVGINPVTCIATDAVGNADTCQFTITVNDTELPVATCPGDIIVPNDPGQCGAVVDFTATVTDNCPGATISCTPPSGSYFPVGVNPVTCIATDAVGNADTCQFTITVNDTEYPVATCPADMTVSNDPGVCGAVVTFTASATDNCPGVAIACVQPSGSYFPVGVTTVTCTATDDAGNADTCQFTITVNDNEDPTISCPAAVTVECIHLVPLPDIGLVTAADNCDNPPTVMHVSDVSDGQTCPETITRTYRATDATGNFAECTQTITVDDTTPPTFDQTCPTDITVPCDSISAPAVLTASDNCDPAVDVVFTADTTAGGCAQEYTITRTWTATDACDNSTQCVQLVTVVDDVAPVITDALAMYCNDTLVYPCNVTIDPVLPGLVEVEDNCDPNPVVTFEEIHHNGACPQEYTLEWIYTATDACGNSSECRFWNTFVDTLAPICVVPSDQAFFLCQASEICLPVICSDNCDDQPAMSIVSGPGSLVDSMWCYTPTADEVATITIHCQDACGNFCESSFMVSFDFNTAPTITCPNDTMVHWGDNYFGQVIGDDPDTLSGPSTLRYYKLAGPTDMFVNPVTGAIQWPILAADMLAACEYAVEIEVVDSCEAADTCSFTIQLWNDTPVISCPTEVTHIAWGYTATGLVSGSDPDTGPASLAYSVVSFDGPGMPTVDAVSGDWSWETLEEVPYLGHFTLCLAVTDAAAIGCEAPTNPNNSDTCCVEIHVVSTLDIFIEKTHDTYQGRDETVMVWAQDGILDMGGFDLLIGYDGSALSFTKAEPGQLLEDCGWEYFTYRYGADGNCGDACPSGLLRIIAIAETNNGPNHPSCYGPPDTDPHALAELVFHVTNDRTFECQYVPIYFFWDDCNDNAVSSMTGDTLYIDRAIYDFEGNLIWDEEDDDQFPEDGRIPWVGAPDYCIDPDPDKPSPVRLIDFHNGGVDIICADSIDDRADINLNGIAYEIADAVLLSNYFIYGLSVFNENLEGQVAASDVNADGITLSVADLVYLIRVIVGDAMPYAKVRNQVDVSYRHLASGVLTTVGTQTMGAVLVVINGEVEPQLLAEGTELKVHFDGSVTRILIYSLSGNSFTGEFLAVSGELVSVEMATAAGQLARGNLIPNQFALYQNYPNPFNPTTTIAFSLPEAADYRLTIYNVMGQVVAEFSDGVPAGNHDIEWNSSGEASGVYFYRLSAGKYTDTKKMLMLK